MFVRRYAFVDFFTAFWPNQATSTVNEGKWALCMYKCTIIIITKLCNYNSTDSVYCNHQTLMNVGGQYAYAYNSIKYMYSNFD